MTQERIKIIKGDCTGFNGQFLLTLKLNTEILDLSSMKASFSIGSITKMYDDISSGVVYINLTGAETDSLPFGNIFGAFRIYDQSGCRATIETMLPFYVTSTVHGDAIATKPYEYTINVEQGGENILNIDVQLGIGVAVGETVTLPAGSDAYVHNVGTDSHLVLDFGIPKGDQGEQGEQGEPGKDGPAGKDATINGVNTLLLNTIYGISLTQSGDTATISGKEITDVVDGISEKIPAQATAQNQLADKAFVNSSIATNTANFIGTFNSLADLEAYSGTVTNNDYAFVIGTDSQGNTIYDRYKYTTATTPASWVYEYTLNNSSFTANQWAAINSGATTTNIGQITTNQNAIGTLGSLTTTTKTDLVSAINEVNTTASGKVSDVKVDGTSIVSSGVADIVRANGSTFGVVKINSPNGIAMSSNGQLYINKATDAEIEGKTNNYKPIVPANLDKAIVEGVSDNSITLTETQKKNARTWQGVANSADLVPDFDSMPVLETHTFDVNTTDFYEIFTKANNSGTFDNPTEAQFEVWCRITTTNSDGTSTTPRIYQELDCVFREFGSSTQVLYGVMRSKPESVTAASTGIQNLRSVSPKAINSGKNWAIEVKPYNQTARKVTVQVYKTAPNVTWNDTAVVTSYDSNHQNVYTSSPYNNPGYVFLGQVAGTISNAGTATTSGYITGSLSKTLASSTLRNTGYVITGNSLLFKVKGQSLLAGIQNTSVAIDTDFGICQAGTTAASTATTTYTYTNFFQKHQFTPASSVNFSEAYDNGDLIYARFTLSNGEIYSDNICSKNPTAGHTWYCIGMATSSSAINFDNTESYFFTLDANGNLTHIDGKPVAQTQVIFREW